MKYDRSEHRRPGRPKNGRAPELVREYLIPYHEERNHQGLDNQLILPPANINRPGPIVCR